MRTAPRSAIVVEGLTKSFKGTPALAGVSLRVEAGTIFGLLGPNGAGKTTTVRILTTIVRPDRGRVRVLGYDIVRQPQAVRERIGLAGQYAAVDENLTGRENLRLIGRLTQVPRRRRIDRADELLDVFGLADAADRPARTYSGGMRRRLDLAAALVHRPPVLFLDEPTTGLDIASRTDLWRVLEQLTAEGTTILLTTQYLEEADRLADHLVVIDHGRVIARGTPATLKQVSGTTRLEISFVTRIQARAASRLLAYAPRGDPYTLLGIPSIEGRTVHLPVTDGARSLVQVVRILDRGGTAPIGIRLREPSLDDVFLQLTGHRNGAS